MHLTFHASRFTFDVTMRLHLGGHLDWYDPQKRAWLDLHLDTPLLLTDLLQQLGIPAGESPSWPWIDAPSRWRGRR